MSLECLGPIGDPFDGSLATRLAPFPLRHTGGQRSHDILGGIAIHLQEREGLGGYHSRSQVLIGELDPNILSACE